MAACGLLLSACAATSTPTLPPASDTQPDWPGLFGDITLAADQLDFRHRIRLSGVDGAPLADGALQATTAHCEDSNCRVRPGPHQLAIEYEWSSTKTLGDERAEGFLSALFLATLLMGGGGGGDLDQDPGQLRCAVTLEVAFFEGRQYRLLVSHSNQRLAPEKLGVVDIDAGEYVAESESCRPQVATAESP
ncbi:MAG: hypothetical protein R3358_11800 [Woeseiaceae bacterium]|nr:hypothetical protein [Woeseiaceae bacterium]